MTLEEYLNEEKLDEAKSLGAGPLKELIKGYKKVDPRTVKFYLGAAPPKHEGTDVELNAFKPQLEKINGLIKEYNEMIRKIETDAVPDADANKGFAKKIKSLKKQIDKIDADLIKRRDKIESKMKEYDKQKKAKEGKMAGRAAKEQSGVKKKMEKMRKSGKLMPTNEDFKKKVKKLLGD